MSDIYLITLDKSDVDVDDASTALSKTLDTKSVSFNLNQPTGPKHRCVAGVGV